MSFITSRLDLALPGLAGLLLVVACAEVTPYEGEEVTPAVGATTPVTTGGTSSTAPPATTTPVTVGGAPSTEPSAGAGGEAPPPVTSDLFNPVDYQGGASGSEPAQPAGCEGAQPGVCDWGRLTECCSDIGCEFANGSDIYNTWPVDQCKEVLECLEENDCSTAADPLCSARDGIATSPCTETVENAGDSTDYTLEIVNCVCGY